MTGDDYLAGMLERTQLFYDKERVDKVRNTTVAIAGFGGVGAITAELLARWGVKRFRLLDKDRYEHSNLNRQLFATAKTIGAYKVDVAAERIKEIYPEAEIEVLIRDSVDNDNVHEFVKGAGMVIQTADSPSCQLFYRAARQHKVPLVNGYSTITGVRVQAYDYSKDSWWHRMEALKEKKKWQGKKDITEMSREELQAFDSSWMPPPMPSINFITNIAGAMIVCEAIKLLTHTGRVCYFPRAIDLDLYANKMRVKNLYSPFSLEAIRKILGHWKNNNRFKSFIENRKKRVGILPS